MSKFKTSLHTDLGHSTPDNITVRGLDLRSQKLDDLNLGDMAFLALTGRMPTPQESVTFNAIVVTLVEHGITPNASGAPDLRRCVRGAAGGCGHRSAWPGHDGRGNLAAHGTRPPARAMTDVSCFSNESRHDGTP